MKTHTTTAAIAVAVLSSGLFGCAIKPPPERGTSETVSFDKSGKSRPTSESWKSNGEFGAQLVLVDDGEQLFKRWNAASDIVEFSTVDQVPVNGAVSAYIVFSGCTKDKEGNCSVVMRFHITEPDGRGYSVGPLFEVWDQKPAPSGTSLGLSAQYLKTVIEPRDQLGKYTIDVQVRDNNSGAGLQLSAPFAVVTLPKDK